MADYAVRPCAWRNRPQAAARRRQSTAKRTPANGSVAPTPHRPVKLRPLLAVLGLLACAASHAATLAPAAAQDLSRRLDELATAFQAHDFERFARETFPGVVAMSGGHDAMIATVRTSFAQMDAQRIVFVSHSSHAETAITDAGRYEVVRVPEDSVLKAGERQVRIVSYSLAVRSKPAGPWTFIGGTGIHNQPQILWDLLPGLPKDFKLPPYSMQPI